MSITYNHQPNKPTNLRATSPTMSCTGAVDDRPWTRDNTPMLRATFTDKDTSQNLRGHFYWEKHDGSSYTDRVSKNTGVYAAQGEQAYQMPTLSDGWYRWQSRGYDAIIHSDYSSYCYFVVDTTRPAAPAVSIAAPYLFGWWHDPVVGLPQATITVSRGSDTTVDRLRYQIGGGAQTTVSMTSSTRTITFTPPYGSTELKFWLLDKAGNVSDETTQELNVMSPRVQHGWLFNEGTGTSSADIARPSTRPLSLSRGSGTWSSGYRADTSGASGDSALHFNGTGSGATTSGPAVFNRDSFTVTARVRLDQLEPGDSFYAVGQDGSIYPAFKMGYHPSSQSWSVYMHNTGSSGGGYSSLNSAVGPIDNLDGDGLPCGSFPFPACDGVPEWQHLAVVYDASASKLRLYVDGDLAAERDWTFSWDATGPLRIGRGQNAGTTNGGATGKVDDVTVFDAALTEAQIRRIKNASFADELQVRVIQDDMLQGGLAGWWPATEGAGIAAADTSGNGHEASLQSGASWAADGPGGGAALSLDGISGHARTSGPVLDTTSSFSVSAWARLDQLGDWHTIAAQEGTAMSPFRLMYRQSPDGWCFTMRLTDQPGGSLRSACGPKPIVGRWTHLAGVYDAAAQQARLYVDGVMVNAVDVPNLWQATGSFLIGRTWDVGGVGTGDHFPGDIAQVRAYQRVLSPAEIAYLGREELS